MWYAGGCFVILAGLCALSALSADSCSDLQKRWLRGRPRGIPVRVKGDEAPVTVWGEGGAPRAAAALLLVTMRDVLGFSARLLPAATAKLCDLADFDNWRSFVIVAPAALLPSIGCDAGQRQIDLVSALAPAASAFSIHLLAHQPLQKCAQFLRNSSIYTNTFLENCGFIESNSISTKNGSCDKCFAVLARNESEHDYRVAIELQRRIEGLNLPLQIIYFKTDLLLRKMILKLQSQSKAFLFLDEDVWTGVSNIIHWPPPLCVDPSDRCSYGLDPSNAVRIGDGEFMKRFAPPILSLVKLFSPESEDLRQILENEVSLKNITNIEEAACNWALKNENKLQNWTSIENIDRRYPPVYEIKVYLCESDPDFNEHINVLNITAFLLWTNINELDYNVNARIIDCLDTDNYKWEISSTAREQRVAGVVAWGWSITDAIAKEAEYGQLPVLLAGSTSPEVSLDSAVAVHAVAASLTNLTNAYLELFQRCEWSRFAVLSDNTRYSENFIKLLLNKKDLLIRERIVSSKDIGNTLEIFRKEDARIFLVNTNWNIAESVLCTALKLGMTPDAGYMWIVRDWRVSKNCSKENGWGNMYHFTLGVAWRGGLTAGGSMKLQTELRKLWRTSENDLIGSADSASLADALLLLGHGFANFLHEFPSHMYDLHGRGNALNFSKSLHKLIVNGTAKELKGKSDEKLVFIEKWHGSKGSSVALWYVTPNGVVDFWPNETATCKKLLGNQPADRHHCITFTTGDPFAPRCHVLTVSIVITLLTLVFIALFAASRARLSSLRRREKEESQRVVSWLDSFLVSRNSITLFHVIGSGSYGKVHFAELKKPGETVLVAAKEPRECIALFEENEFLREACVLAPLCHENVIRLIGVCVGGGPPIVLMEHAYYNDLQRYLTFRRQFAISARLGEVTVEEAMEVSDGELTRFAREAARALEYLSDKRLVHRDVRAANCLVDKNRSLKLADFGMARELDNEASLYITTRRGLFPVLWMPPESVRDGAFSTASDIWALGVLILEVATLGARPYGGWPLVQVLHYIKSGGHPPLPPDTSKHTRSLVLACWQLDVNSRPSATFVYDFLTRNPLAISPALLTPDMPEPCLYSTKRDRTFDEIERRSKTRCDLISM